MESQVASGGLLEDLESRHDEMLEELDRLDSRIGEAITQCQELRKGILGDEPDSSSAEVASGAEAASSDEASSGEPSSEVAVS